MVGSFTNTFAPRDAIDLRTLHAYRESADISSGAVCTDILHFVQQGRDEPERCRELPHASPELEDLLSKFRLGEVRHIQTDHDRRRDAEPPTGRRAGHSESGGDGHVPGPLDEIPKPVVVALLRAGRVGHGNDDRPFRHTAQLFKDSGEYSPP